MADDIIQFAPGGKVTAEETNENNLLLKEWALDNSQSEAYIDGKISTLTNNLNSQISSINTQLAKKANINNPTFTGTVKVPNSTATGTPLNISNLTKERKGCLLLGCGVKFQWMYISKATFNNNDSVSVSWKKNFTSGSTYSTTISQVNHSGSDNNIAITSQDASSITVYAESAERSGGIYAIAIGY